MTETTEATTVETHTTVKQYRDDIRKSLSEAYKAAGKYDPQVGEATEVIRRTLKGKVGFSKAQQTEALQATLEQYTAAAEAIDAIDPAAVAAKVEADKATAKAALEAAIAATHEAIDFAAERDFDAYYAEKQAAKYGPYGPGSEYDESDEEDEDDDY
jgi:hypothetical protein